MRQANFSLFHRQVRFDTNGDILDGYELVLWNWAGQTWNYSVIGSYDNSGGLSIDKEKLLWHTEDNQVMRRPPLRALRCCSSVEKNRSQDREGIPATEEAVPPNGVCSPLSLTNARCPECLSQTTGNFVRALTTAAKDVVFLPNGSGPPLGYPQLEACAYIPLEAAWLGPLLQAMGLQGCLVKERPDR